MMHTRGSIALLDQHHPCTPHANDPPWLRNVWSSLQQLEAEVILLVSLPESTRSHLVQLMNSLKSDIHTAVQSTLAASGTIHSGHIGTPAAAGDGSKGTMPPTFAASPTSPNAGFTGNRVKGSMAPAPPPPLVTSTPLKVRTVRDSTAPSPLQGGPSSGRSLRAVATVIAAASTIALPTVAASSATSAVSAMTASPAAQQISGGTTPTPVTVDMSAPFASAISPSEAPLVTSSFAQVGSSAVAEHMPVNVLDRTSISNPQLHGVLTSTAVPTAVAAAHSSLVPATQMPANYGHCITAALYLTLESILCGCQADRMVLFAKQSMGGQLQLAACVGAGVPPATKVVVASPVGVVHAVFQTCIAANLDAVTLEDVAECPGPTVAKNAIAFPVLYINEENREVMGVVLLVNKQRGTRPFDTADEQVLHQRLPVIGYILHQYRLQFHSYPFDATPLHRLVPMPLWAPPAVVMPKSMVTAPFTQRVYHRSGTEKFIRKQALLSTDEFVPLDSAAEQLTSVEAYLGVMEDCWKRSIADRIDVELSLRQKMQHLTDAREILIRKQKKFDILKQTLCEQLEKNVTESRVMRQRAVGLDGSSGGSGRLSKAM